MKLDYDKITEGLGAEYDGSKPKLDLDKIGKELRAEGYINVEETTNTIQRGLEDAAAGRVTMKELDDIIEGRGCSELSLIDQITRWIHDAYWYLRYTTVNNYRVIKIRSLVPGYYDADTRLFFGAFDLLVEFCEVELAWMAMMDESVKVPWWQTENQYRKAHAEELVMQYFKWAQEFKEEVDGVVYDHPKADAHKELKALYLWFKHERPNRPNPTDFWWTNRKDPTAFKKSMEMEKTQEAENANNLIRLMKNRGALWT